MKTPSPTEIKLYFSEAVSEFNTHPDSFEVSNSSTGVSLPVSAVSPAGQTISLTFAPPSVHAPFVLVAGHVFDVRYNAAARDNNATASGTRRFKADFWPPPPPAMEAWKDSLGNVLLLWAPDNRIGNTGIEIWKKVTQVRSESEQWVAAIAPNISAFWTVHSDNTTYALQMVNDYGKSGLGEWIGIKDARVGSFACRDVCLKDLTWQDLPPGYELSAETTTCFEVEYINRERETRLIRKISPQGIVQLSIGPEGTGTDSTFNWCK